MTKQATIGPLVSLDPAMAALAARTAAAWRAEQDQIPDAAGDAAVCQRRGRPLVDHDDGACPEVTAETVTREQIDRYHNTIMISDASSVTADSVARTCGLAKNSDIPSRIRMTARADIAAAINARANGGR